MPYPIGTIVGWDGRHSSDGTGTPVPNWTMHGGNAANHRRGHGRLYGETAIIGRPARMTRLTDATSVGRPGRDHVVLLQRTFGRAASLRGCGIPAHLRVTDWR